MVGGNPPTMMQFNTGKQFDELVSNGLVRDVDKQAQAGKWREIMPKPIVDAVVREGKFYAVPVNIHGQNWMFYNTKIFADAGLEPPKTFPELIETGEKLKAKGIIPIALGGQPTWEHNLFRAVVVGHGGADMFRKLYGARDQKAMKDPKFKETVEVFGKLRGLVDPGSPGRNWNDATSLVITNKAAMHFNGDWAKGEFIAAGQSPGKEYGCTIVGQEPKDRDRWRRVRFPRHQGQSSTRDAGQVDRSFDRPDEPDRVQQEKGFDPGAHGRGRFLHGRLRAEISHRSG